MANLKKMELLVFLLLLGNGQALADAAAPGEYEVKAAFIHHFVQFVAWPSDGQTSLEHIRLCILGADPFGNAINVILGKRSDIQTWKIRFVGTAIEARECRVVFAAASETGRLKEILAKLDGNAILTIGDSEGFAERGLIINFYLENRKVRFEINLDAARRAGLSISSQLLKLARIVHSEGDSDDR